MRTNGAVALSASVMGDTIDELCLIRWYRQRRSNSFFTISARLGLMGRALPRCMSGMSSRHWNSMGGTLMPCQLLGTNTSTATVSMYSRKPGKLYMSLLNRSLLAGLTGLVLSVGSTPSTMGVVGGGCAGGLATSARYSARASSTGISINAR